MDLISRKASSFLSKSSWRRRLPWLLIPVMVLSFAIAHAQTLTGTLSGSVEDQTGAKIPGASITIVSDTSGDKRDTKADSSGFFSVTALPPGSYTVTIATKGFATYKETGIQLNEGDSRTIPNIHLKISSDVNSVTVVSGENVEVPVDTAEISSTLNNEMVDSAVLTGRNASELVKMMPGVTFDSAGGVGGYNGQVTGTNSGPAGSFSANGTQPYGSTAIILDGANLVDPGNAGTQIANINQDMTDSVKFLTASYGAEYAKGPAILEAFSKSGGQKYHGEAYIYARNSQFGWAVNAQNKEENPGATNPPADYYYIGGNVGGPISFLGFNKNKDKLFFWGGYEYMIQHPYVTPVEMNVPTADQVKGDFNNTGIPLGVYDPSNGSGAQAAAYALPCQTSGGWQGCGTADSPWGGYGANKVPNLSSYFDANGSIASGLNPAANQAPTGGNGWNNYVYSPAIPQNRWEGTGKVTYAFNDNNKLWGSYTYQHEVDQHPLSVWWMPATTIPYPGKPVGTETAKVYLANYTHVFNATTTNEFVFSYAEFVNDNAMSSPAAISPGGTGFPQQSLFGHTQSQIPTFDGAWSAGLTWIGEVDFAGGIYGKNSFGKTAKDPAISDNFTKIVKTHSLKGGFYWDTSENLQSSSAQPGVYQGQFEVSPWSGVSTTNTTLDRLLGRNSNYNELSTDPVPDEKFHQWSLWAQDSWKLNPKITLNLGLRADHEGQWYDTLGGTQVWDPALYNNTSSAPANTGLAWTKTLSSVPSSGWGSQLFLWDPRLGVAYDITGQGKTVVRAGYGTYRYQLSNNDGGQAMNGPLGSFTFGTGGQVSNGFYGYDIAGGVLQKGSPGANQGATTLNVPAGLNQNGGSVSADKLGDNKVPYANTYSFGVAQALPSHIVAQMSYVGSVSHNQYLGQNSFTDADDIAMGAYFKADPITGQVQNPAPINGTSGLVEQDYRPLHNYTNMYVLQHGGHANYNSLQAALQKSSGNLFMFTNFTFGKVLGTLDGDTSNGNGNGNIVVPYVLNDNYGPLGYDHTKSFNFSASYKLPSPVHNNLLVGELVNGWQLSNYTTYEDGSPYQANNPVMNATYTTLPGKTVNNVNYCAAGQTFTMPNGQQTCSIGTSEWFGTPESPNALSPVLVCDPRKGLGKNQYFNPACFVAPLPPTSGNYGQQGQVIWPYIRTPHYFNSDLAIFKAFKITEAQRVEIRASATDFLNHANYGFGIAGTSDNMLEFSGTSTGDHLSHNTNPSTTGRPLVESGYRWLQIAAKYYF
jgi:hypothetical protein